MIEKVIRDPVHDVIAFRLDVPGDALLFRLINAREFQRLRRIRQLGLGTLVYPGADHSRYSHSLGVMETARRMLDRLAESSAVDIDPDERTACLAAALLHDLGHGPFSHVFERVSGVSHEAVTRRIILDDTSEVHRILADHDRGLPQRIEQLIHCTGERTFFHDVLCSQLDADRFDYLLRDNLMTGSRYGHFDLRWLLQHLTVDPDLNRLAVTHKGTSAIEAYLQGRYHMYRNVYFHKVVRSAEGMIRLALQRAKRLAVQERLPWPTPDDAVHKALVGRQLDIDEFVDLDEVSVMGCFKSWSRGEDAILARLCRGLLFRDLYKSVDVTGHPGVPAVATEGGEDTPATSALVERVADAIDDAGGESGYAMFYDEPADTPYEANEPADQILIRDAAGNVRDFLSISPMVGALNRQLMFRRIHFDGEYREVVRAMCG